VDTYKQRKACACPPSCTPANRLLPGLWLEGGAGRARVRALVLGWMRVHTPLVALAAVGTLLFAAAFVGGGCVIAVEDVRAAACGQKMRAFV